MLAYIDRIAQHPRYHQAFHAVRYLSYALFGAAFLGITAVNKAYLADVNAVVKICVGLVLAIRFNPWARRAVSKESATFDREVAFSGGIILLLASARSVWSGSASLLARLAAQLSEN